ncbi:SDR family NAD(P)-dependent oxidoreductase [Deinococcus aquiradiocola]|uniref:Oxidoreductase n=1 Tax=Deinococcus aquiradiocola TaxID=393059 RepID=A0A917PGQ9_9DEIO|nr:SDR family oxidoreductase [Deinococcus aquiradiocola]GGJ76215.1 oxidoreductase [Deinococcus aquiradiocola]
MTQTSTTPPGPTRPTALITGASGGIGEAIARQLAARHTHLILVARNESRLQTLATELQDRHGVHAHVIAQDLTAPHATDALWEQVQTRNLQVDFLVNNAGFADYGEFHTLDRARQLDMIQVNVTVLTDLTHRFLPGMVQRSRGRVLNIASTAAFMPGPLMAVYYATKAYVLSFSEALNEELRGTGVHVTAACPGPVATGFQAAAQMEGSRLIATDAGQRAIMTPDTVAAEAVDAMLHGQSVRVIGLMNRVQAFLPRLVPRALLPRIVKQVQDRAH